MMSIVGLIFFAFGLFIGYLFKKVSDKPQIQMTVQENTESIITNDMLKQQRLSLQSLIEALEKEYEEKAMIVANDKVRLEQSYQEAIATVKKRYDETVAILDEQIKSVEDRLNDFKSKELAAVEANKRKFEAEHKQDFYRLIIPEKDVQDIKQIKKCVPYFKDNGEALNKLIYKIYYERPYNDLINRIFGQRGVVCGIYKITNIQNNMCYVGQSVNIADRFKQHIKCGTGADGSASRNKLYEAMSTVGIENFTFEIIEECPREALNEREDYWQDFFQAKEFGYSLR